MLQRLLFEVYFYIIQVYVDIVFSLVSDHDSLAILSRGYDWFRFYFCYCLFLVSVDVRP